MSGDVQTKVYAWIDRQADGAEPRLERLTLGHMNAAEQTQILSSYRLEGSELGDLKGEIWSTCRHVVAAWSGPQRFSLRAYFAGQEASGAYLPFLLAPDADVNPDEPSSTEPANMVGLLKQLMRHNEASQRTIQVMSLEALTFQSRAVRTAQAGEEAMRARYFETLERHRDSLIAAEERALERELVLRQEKRKDALAERAMAALPVLANQVSNKLGGPKLFANAQTTQELVLADMLGSLDDQKFEALVALFPNPAHQAFLLELLKQLYEKRREQQEEPSNGEDPDPPRH